MNVFALSTWSPYPLVNGSTLRVYHLLRALAARHAVDLVAFSAPGAPTAAEVAHLREFCRAVTILPRSPFEPVASTVNGLLTMTPRSLVATDDPEVRALVASRAATADVAVGFALSAARYLTGVACPAVFEDAEPRQIEGLAAQAGSRSQRLRRRLTWWKHARYLRRLAHQMAAVTVVSEQERESMVRLGADASRLHVVPNGADAADLTHPRPAAAPARLVYPGAVTYRPNLEAVAWLLAEVLPHVQAVRPDVELWVTGDTGRVDLEQWAGRTGVRFTGRLPDVRDAVGAAAVAVVPLRTGGGTRLKILEALALGTPVVSTRKGAEGLAVSDGEHVLLGDDPAAFAAAVLRVLAEPGLAARLSAAGRALVARHYTWDAIGRQFLDVLEAAGRSPERH
ncbi:MAG: glycosyltransferase [Acidobacteria bacterium]|nr:glycosyltransferase [Acidobacteriota bacterium]